MHSGKCPQYLCEKLKAHNPNPVLRSTNQNLLQIPKARYKSKGERRFAVQGPRLWNTLPTSIRLEENHLAFRRKIKTHLFWGQRRKGQRAPRGDSVCMLLRYISFSLTHCALPQVQQSTTTRLLLVVMVSTTLPLHAHLRPDPALFAGHTPEKSHMGWGRWCCLGFDWPGLSPPQKDAWAYSHCAWAFSNAAKKYPAPQRLSSFFLNKKNLFLTV